MLLQIGIQGINTAIVLTCGIIFFIVLLLLFFVFLYRKSHNLFLKQKELMKAEFMNQLMQSKIEVQEQTFTSLGQELHDNVGQLLGSAKMLIGITERNLPEIPVTLRTADDTLAEAISNLRALSKSLNKEWLSRFSLIQNLRAEAERINSGQTVHIDLVGDTEELLLESDRQTMLFRIVQEAIQNSIRHGKAKQISIILRSDDSSISLSVKDNGTGFDTLQPVLSGVGILHLRQRTRLLNGTIEWQAVPGGGTTVSISIPVTPLA